MCEKQGNLMQYPNINTIIEKIKDRNSPTDLFSFVVQAISKVNFKPIADYTSKDRQFIEKDLYEIIIAVIDYNHSPPLYHSIEHLFFEVLNLTIATELDPAVIQSMIPFFDRIDPREPNQFNVNTEMVMNCFDFENSPVGSASIVCRPNISEINESLTKAIFKSVFTIIWTRLIHNEINIEQMGWIVRFFTSFQPFLEDKSALSITYFFARRSLQILTPSLFSSPAIPLILDYFVTFSVHLFYILDEIFNVIVKILQSDTPNQLSTFQSFLIIARNPTIPRNPETIKDALLSVLKSTTNEEVIKGIYEFIPETRIHFTPDEIFLLAFHIKKFPSEVTHCILHLLPHLTESIDDVAFQMFTSDLVNIDVGLALINYISDDMLASRLFFQVIARFDKLTPRPSFNLTISDRMVHYIISDLNSKRGFLDLFKLGYFLIQFPRYDLLFEYVMKIIESHDFPPFVEILTDFSKVAQLFDGKKLLSTLSQNVIEHFFDSSHSTKKQRNLLDVVILWIDHFPLIPESNILSRLMNIDYSKCSDCILRLINTIFARATDRKIIRTLIMKIMKDTVPEKHANWAMNMAFNAIHEILHDECKDIEKVGENLFHNLSDITKRKNAIHMIYKASLIEADFFNIGGNCNNDLVINSIINDRLFKFSIHPLHSTRRIYVEIGKLLNMHLSKFSISIGKKKIEYDRPLSTVPFKVLAQKALRITVEDRNCDDKSRYSIQPYFLRFLQRAEHFSFLFSMMNDFSIESEKIFLILNLVDIGTVKPVLSSPIQQVFRKDYFMPLVDLDSFSLFPFVLSAGKGNNSFFSNEYLSSIFQSLSSHYLDEATLLLSLNEIIKYSPIQCDLDGTIIKHCLINDKRKLVRKTIAEILAKTDQTNKLLPFLNCTIQNEYRNQTKEYFSLLKLNKINGSIVEPLLFELDQYEIDPDGSADQTFRGILSIITNPSTESIWTVLNYLFAFPTIKSPSLPFLQTPKSRKIAFDFLKKSNIIYDHLFDLVISINSRQNNFDLGFSTFQRCFIEPIDITSNILTALYSAKPFRNYVISHTFDGLILNELSQLFIEKHFSACRRISIDQFHSLKSENHLLPESIFHQLIFEKESLETLFDFFHLKILRTEHPFETFCAKKATKSTKSCLFYFLNFDENLKSFAFPIVFDNFQLSAVSYHSKSEHTYKTIFKDDKYSNRLNIRKSSLYYPQSVDIPIKTIEKTQWLITEKDHYRKYDISHYLHIDFDLRKPLFLVYTNQTTPSYPLLLNQTIQEKINLKNQHDWPSVICFNRQFIRFIRQIFEQNPDECIEIFIVTFLNIVLIDEQELDDWSDVILKKVVNHKEKCQLFLSEFFRNDNFIFNLNTEKSLSVFSQIFQEIGRQIKPITFDQITNLVHLFDDISNEYQFLCLSSILNSIVDFSVLNIDQIDFILMHLTKFKEKSKFDKYEEEVSKLFDCLINIIIQFHNEENEVCPVVLTLTFLTCWKEYEKKSQPFRNMLKSIITDSLIDVSTSIIEMMADIINFREHVLDFSEEEESINDNDVTEISQIDISQMSIDLLKKQILSSNIEVRDQICSEILSAFSKPSESFINFIDHSLFNEISKPDTFNDTYKSAAATVFLSILDESDDKVEINRYDDFLGVLEAMFYIWPNIIADHIYSLFHIGQRALKEIDSQGSILLMKIVRLIHHILAFEKTILAKIDISLLILFMNNEAFVTKYSIQLLHFMNLSPIDSYLHFSRSFYSKCFQYCLEADDPESSQLVYNLVKKGKVLVEPFVCHATITSVDSLMLIRILWEQADSNEQKVCIQKALQHTQIEIIDCTDELRRQIRQIQNSQL